MKQLTKEEIASQSPLVIEEVPVPRWGGSVFVREMNGPERDRFEEIVYQRSESDRPAKMKAMRVWLAVFTICNPSGERFYGEADFEAVAKMSGAALTSVFAAAIRINRLGNEDIEELVKGFPQGQSANSISA